MHKLTRAAESGMPAVEDVAVVSVSIKTKKAWTSWASLIVFSIQGLAIAIDYAITSVLVHPIEVAFRINDVGYAASTFAPLALGLGLAYYPAGVAADSFPRKYVIFVAAAIWAAAAFLAARATSTEMLFCARLLAGIGSGLPWPSIFSAISDSFPPERRVVVLSVFWAVLSMSTGIGLAACGALFATVEHAGAIALAGMFVAPWQQCFLACALIGALVAPMALFVKEPARRERMTNGPLSLKSSLVSLRNHLRGHGRLWVFLIVGTALGQTGNVALRPWAVTLGARHFGVAGASATALLGLVNSIAALAAFLVGGLLVQRGLNHENPGILPRMLIAGAALIGILSIAVAFLPNWALAVAVIGMLTGVGAMLELVFQSTLQEAAPNDIRGQLFGLNGSFLLLPNSLGPLLLAFLASGVFANAGGLSTGIVVVGAAGSLIGVTILTFAGPLYIRARDELRMTISLPMHTDETNAEA